MHIKFLAHGTGSARAAAKYLLGEQDAAGKPREGVEVLRGNPDMVAAVADSLEFEHRYTSGVIAWAPDDHPTDEQIEAILDEFEKTAWAGLESDRYAWAAVLHREEGGGAHVHVLAARCDLETGRSLNIAPPGWQRTFDPLRDAFNHQHGWGRPDDPARARVQQPGHRAYIEAAQLRAGLRLEASPRDLIRDYLIQRVEHGMVRGRHDVVAALREAGLEVPRQGKEYLTALDPETGDRWRLKGELYGENFDRERLGRPAEATAGERAQGDRGVDRERAEAARRELAARREERAQYNRARYGGGGREHARVAGQGVATAPDRRPEPLDRFLRRKLGDDALVGVEHSGPDRDARRTGLRHPGRAADARANGGGHLGGRAAGDRGRAGRGTASGDAGQHGLDVARSACREAVEQVKEVYDRFRGAVDEGLAEIVRAVRAGTAAALRADRSLARVRRSVARIRRSLAAARRAAERGERSLAAANRAARRASDTLGRVLWDIHRRETERSRLVIRPPTRGPDRDAGPSR
ncbi:MAG: relaxase/mobilization nuclease domain-containing protein [Gemmatimonadetes bacterium]|nr:relaxase/mobilization nuclease domain-containing protein [Gemmatimonadota bacterium]MYG23596.1 relaxase/mobilization nuclease domain-containing protein [Gemmatimonadota bacterium]MYJ39253.1 relaxase/mobilization nuclease domain-containing protein [Gemmatimonadota bacterium]